MKYKIKRRHERYFKKRFLFWAEALSVGGWDWTFRKKNQGNGVLACVYRYIEDRFVRVYIAEYWDGVKPTKKEIDKISFHEACEVLVGPLEDLAESRWVTAREIEMTKHALIRRLENFVSHSHSR